MILWEVYENIFNIRIRGIINVYGVYLKYVFVLVVFICIYFIRRRKKECCIICF